MKEFIDKLIGRLEEREAELKNITAECKPTKEIRDKNYGYYTAMNHAKEIVNQLAEEYNNGWIPCSSGKLPKDKERVFITHQIEGYPPKRFEANYSKDIGWYDEETAELFETCEVIAWQPLPEPYQPKGE